MNHRILIGTGNPSKIEIIKAFLETLPIDLLVPADLNLRLSIEEDGATTQENAEKKSRAYFAATGVPTISFDAGLCIKDFPPDKQPGVLVRRIFGSGQEVSDRQMLDYYIRELELVGGKSTALWDVACSFTISSEETIVQTYSFEAALLSIPSPTLLPGVPLSSLMVDYQTGKYFSEMNHRERADAEWVKKIMEKNLERLA